jgi:hypothetical protein
LRTIDTRDQEEAHRMSFSVVPPALAAFAAANDEAGEMISSAGSADASAMLAAAAAAVGPIGATYLAAYVPAQGNTLAGTLMVGAAHDAIGAATEEASASFVAVDNG